MLAVAAILATLLFLATLQRQLADGFDLGGLAVGSAFASAAFLCWWVALLGDVASSRERIGRAFLGGCLLGLAGFLLWSCGLILLGSDANQGPLTGIFITGPLGFTVGTVLGALYRRPQARATRMQ